MAAPPDVRVSVTVDERTFDRLREIAANENRSLAEVITEALAKLIADRVEGQPRPEVMAVYETSIPAFDTLYRKLAE